MSTVYVMFHDMCCVMVLPSFCLSLSFSFSLLTTLSFTLLLLLSLHQSLQAKVRDLEEKCRSQGEQFNLLSKELEKFRLQAGLEILSTAPLTVGEPPGSPSKTLSQLLNGLAAPGGKGLFLIPILATTALL